MTSTNNKRIARNTLMLYFRMLITMFVSLYTVRIVLNTLGVIDYGIYNVVGGIVVMFSFMSNTLASASQRFFSFEIGKNNNIQLHRTFSVTFFIYIFIAIFILIIAETLGLWFLNVKMEIPPSRIVAANWVFQFSILSFLVSIITIPYNAIIIARENMSIYAYLSIIEVILKLAIVYLLLLFTIDKLKLYAVLMFLATSIISLSYLLYGLKKYKESRVLFFWDSRLFKTLISFSGWNLFGAIAGVFNTQGINILLNLFFGPIINASRGIAIQINYVINQFVLNFNTAVNPQITKYFAVGEIIKMRTLVFKSSKYSFFLISILSMPVLLEANFFLSLWLKQVPENLVLFTRLVIINALVDSLSYSIQTAVQATGRIKLYQSVVGGMLILNLPICYIFFKLGFQPQYAFYISIFISIICLFLRLIMLKRILDFSFKEYCNNVLIIVASITLFNYSVLLFVRHQFDESLFRALFISILSLTTSIILIFYLGLGKAERGYFITLFKSKFVKKNRNEY